MRGRDIGNSKSDNKSISNSRVLGFSKSQPNNQLCYQQISHPARPANRQINRLWFPISMLAEEQLTDSQTNRRKRQCIAPNHKFLMTDYVSVFDRCPCFPCKPPPESSEYYKAHLRESASVSVKGHHHCRWRGNE